MDNPQYYQPLSHALHPPLVSSGHSNQQQQYTYGSHTQPAAVNGAGHREEEEEEEEDDEEIVEEELDHHDTQAPSAANPSPHPSAPAQNLSAGSAAASANNSAGKAQAPHDQSQQVGTDDDAGKRKPGRPRGSRNRKPRAAPSSTTKPPTNTQHPGFYQYPPAPASGGAVSQNQQFYEFQWRALNLCSEFYNAAEELVKAASPMVIAQCYQMGPATKVDPLAMIADAKRVCDNLLANPSQLVGSPPPPVYSMGSYGQMAPPPPTASSASSSSTPASGPVITNAGSFIMPLAGHAMPPPAAPPQSYYPAMYATAAGGYPRAPYYPYAPQPAASYYPPPSQPVTTPVQSSPPPAASTTGTISTFNAATGTAAPGGQQGTWSEEETDRLRKLAEQSREMGGPQNKGEIEWDWVVSQWGNSRTRHQILLKATSMGLKESTTRGTKRRRETDASANENEQTPTPTAQSSQVTTAAATSTPSTAQTQATTHTHAQTTHAPAAPVNTTAQSATTSASPALAPQRPPSSSTSQTIAPARTAPTSSPAMANARPWPMPTVAANTPSPVLASAQTDRNNYYRPPPTQTPSYGTTGTTPYGTNTSAANTASYATHQYMYRPNGTSNTGRRDGS